MNSLLGRGIIYVLIQNDIHVLRKVSAFSTNFLHLALSISKAILVLQEKLKIGHCLQ